MRAVNWAMAVAVAAASVSISARAEASPNCGVNLAAPEVRSAIDSLPRVSYGGIWNHDPQSIVGNYDACATLSAALVTVEGAQVGSPWQSLLFHDGRYVGTATPDAYVFTSLNTDRSTDDTVALDYTQSVLCGGCAGPVTTVLYQWQGDHVAMMGVPPSPNLVR